jgi:hypothetical protein
MLGASIKKPRRELRGLLDQHYRNKQNNTVSQHEPIITPCSTNRRTRKRRLDRTLSEERITCETVERVLGSTVSNCSPPSTSPPEKSNTSNRALPLETVTEKVSVVRDDMSLDDTVTCHPVTKESYSNVILPWENLLNFMCTNFCCGKCKQPISKGSFEKLQISFATSVNFFCAGCTVASLPAETREKRRLGTKHPNQFHRLRQGTSEPVRGPSPSRRLLVESKGYPCTTASRFR